MQIIIEIFLTWRIFRFSIESHSDQNLKMDETMAITEKDISDAVSESWGKD